MLVELFNRIVELSRESQQCAVQRVPGVQSKVLLKIPGKAEPEWVPAERPRVQHKVQSLMDFITLARDKAFSPSPQVWCETLTMASAMAKLHLVLDDKERRDVLTMDLNYSSRMAKLILLNSSNQKWTGPELIKFIRFDLQGVGADDLIVALRTLDWTRVQGGSTKSGHGRESLGMSVEAQVAQAERIPETFVANVPVWQAAGCASIHAQVTCGVYIDVAEQRLVVRPLADQIEIALQRAAAELHVLIAKQVEPILVVTGKPEFVVPA